MDEEQKERNRIRTEMLMSQYSAVINIQTATLIHRMYKLEQKFAQFAIDLTRTVNQMKEKN